MVFDVPSRLYWRPEEGGLLFGMSPLAESVPVMTDAPVIDTAFLAAAATAELEDWARCRRRPRSSTCCPGR
jgi:hypothetical protein